MIASQKGVFIAALNLQPAQPSTQMSTSNRHINISVPNVITQIRIPSKNPVANANPKSRLFARCIILSHPP